VGALEQEQPPWIEEREAETSHDTRSSSPKQITLECAGTAEDRGDLHTIPGNLSAGKHLIVQITQANKGRSGKGHQVQAVPHDIIPYMGDM
jgi:hypothetical protein